MAGRTPWTRDSLARYMSGLPARAVEAALALSLAGAAACAAGRKRPPTGTPEPDKFLYERGTEALNERKWLTAREYFRQLVGNLPAESVSCGCQARHRRHLYR